MISVKGADALTKSLDDANKMGLKVEMRRCENTHFGYVVDGVPSPLVLYDDINGPMQLAEWLQQQIASTAAKKADQDARRMASLIADALAAKANAPPEMPVTVVSMPTLDPIIVAVRQVHEAKRLMAVAANTLGDDAVDEIFSGYEPHFSAADAA